MSKTYRRRGLPNWLVVALAAAAVWLILRLAREGDHDPETARVAASPAPTADPRLGPPQWADDEPVVWPDLTPAGVASDHR